MPEDSPREAEGYRIPWVRREDLADENSATLGRCRDARTRLVGGEMQRTVEYLAWAIARRLRPNSGPPPGPDLFRAGARADAVRVLGYLRPAGGLPCAAVLDQLIDLSLNPRRLSEGEIAACVHALGLIDLPVVRQQVNFTLGSTEVSPNRQRVAVWVLGRVLGRYAIPFLEDAARQHSLSDAEVTPDAYRWSGSPRARQIEGLLQHGRKHGWFAGGVWGEGEPGAYDLDVGASKAT